jgi:hypothetical protein
VTAYRRAIFPGINGTQEASGRAQEFRTVDGQLQQLGDGHVWRPYVPFGRMRGALPKKEERVGQRRDQTWREEARQRLEAKAVQRRAEMEGRMIEQGQQAQEVPVEQTQETPAVGNGASESRSPAWNAAPPPPTSPKYSDEFKRSATERFRATRNHREKGDLSAELGVPLSTLYLWHGRQAATPPPPPPPPSVDTDFATELDVLARCLALPADARDRIVAYLTARRG